jgi:hypothetical protein
MPEVKVVTSKRTVVVYSMDELKKALGLDDILAVYPLNGMIEVVTESEAT